MGCAESHDTVTCRLPCEVLNLASSPEALQIARNTAHYYFVAQEGYKLMNELGLSTYVMEPA